MRRFALALAAACIASASGSPVWAATFAVDSVADQNYFGVFSDGVCNADDGSPGVPTCTLRAAVEEANGTAGPDTIRLPNLGPDYLLTRAPAGEDFSVGGDLDVRGPLTIEGSGQPVIRSDGDDRVLHIGPSGTNPAVSIANVEIRDGAGVDRGAGIHVDSGSLALTGATVAGNTAASAGGDAEGGGIWFDPGPASTVTSSTIEGNTADGQTGSGGGGVAVGPGGLVTISNSTISGNVASSGAGGASGGGVSVNAGSLAFLQVTLHRNIAAGATSSSGGTLAVAGGSVTARGTIFSDGTGDPGAVNCDVAGGAITSQGFNLEAPSGGISGCSLSSAMSDRFAASAGLADLAPRGGPTRTHALLNGSAALDAIGTCFPFVLDQRGLPRPGGGACEIGSFERQILAPPGKGCFGRQPTIVSRGGGTTITGTPGPDVIVGGNGREAIQGGGGKDRICGGKGNDRIRGGPGGDMVAGEDGNDRIFGEEGKDQLLGNAGTDVLDGGKDKVRDTLNGGPKRDTCRGRGDKQKDC